MKYIKYTVISLIVIACLFYLQKSCNVTHKLSELKGRYEALKEVQENREIQAGKEIADLTRTIKERDGKIENLNQKISVHEQSIEAVNKELEKLEQLEGKVQSDVELILNLRSQRDAWKEKFTLAQRIIEEKDAIIFNLSEKYEAQVKISHEYRTLWEETTRMLTLAELRIEAYEKDKKKLQFSNRMKNVIMFGLVGYVAYNRLKEVK